MIVVLKYPKISFLQHSVQLLLNKTRLWNAICKGYDANYGTSHGILEKMTAWKAVFSLFSPLPSPQHLHNQTTLRQNPPPFKQR
jgi:hypothetical protein